MMLLVMVFFTSDHLGMAVVIATLLMIHMIVNDLPTIDFTKLLPRGPQKFI
jgi:hypothetical protein